MLDSMVLLFDAEDASDGAHAFDSGCVSEDAYPRQPLTVPNSYSIFTLIAQENLVSDLYLSLSMSVFYIR